MTYCSFAAHVTYGRANGARPWRISLKPFGSNPTIRIAGLASGNVAEYRSACEKMLERFRETKSPFAAADFAYASVVKADAISDKQELVRLARIGVNLAPGAQRVHAAALYRVDNYKGA